MDLDKETAMDRQTLGYCKAIKGTLTGDDRKGRSSALLAVIPEHEPLMKFYDVDNYYNLVDAQEEHIQRLQQKLPPLREPVMLGNPRRG